MKTKIAVLTVLCSAMVWAYAQAGGGSTANTGNAAGNPPMGAAGNPPMGAPGNVPNNGGFNNAPAIPPGNAYNNNAASIPPGDAGTNTWRGPGNVTNNGVWPDPRDFNTNSITDPGLKNGVNASH